MRYKALIIDFDGTAIKNNLYAHPTKRVIETIQKAQNKLLVSAATGRPISTARRLIHALQLKNPVIIAAGTKIIDPATEHVLWQVTMHKNTVKQILQTLQAFPYKILTESQLNVFQAKKTYMLQEESVIYIIEVPIHAYKHIIATLQSISNIAIHLVKGYKLHHVDIHVTNKKGSKASALKKLKKMLGVTTEEIIGIGDSYNDLPLFEEVGLKIAMGNAVLELQERADYVTSHVEKDGLAEAIEKFILDQSSVS